MPETSVIILRILLPFTVMLALIPLLVWLERKGSAYIQDRPGPNRAAILGIRLGGLLHPLADVIKLAFKEDFIPSGANRFYYYLAPFLTFCVASVTFLVIPFGSPITFGTQIIHLQAASLNIGILYILAISSLGVYGIMLAGLASHNKFALLGGLRASAQMISYELSLGLAIISLVMTTGSLDLQEMVQQQSPLLWRWNFIRDPLAFLIVIVASFAEINRIPFDLPEGESELVAGYHVEYSSLKFAMFFMAEYLHIIMASVLMATLFLGGWQVPFLSTQMLQDHASLVLLGTLIIFALGFVFLGLVLCCRYKKVVYNDKRDYEVLILGVPALIIAVTLLVLALFMGTKPLSPLISQWVTTGTQIFSLVIKTSFFCWLFIWIRWTLPRVRYDQLMTLGWKFLLPLSLVNLVITAARVMGG